MHQVVVTGFGIVSPIGKDVAEFSRRMFAGESGTVGTRGRIVAPNFPVPVAGLIPRETLGQPKSLANRDPEDTPFTWRIAGLATEEAIESLTPGLPVDAIVYGSEHRGSFDQARRTLKSNALDNDRVDWDAPKAESNLHACRLALSHHGHGWVEDWNLIAISNACVSANQAIGIGLQRIRSGRWKRALVGGVSGHCEETGFMNFHMLMALTVAEVPPATASRPFSKSRSGFVMAEGAASLLLESREEAEARGAKIYGVVTGYGTTSDAYRLTDGRPECGPAIHAMRRALADAGRSADQVSGISAHGTSTPLNDRLETFAIKQVFGERVYRVPVVGLKSQVGHSISAAAAQEAVASLLMLREQRLAPTINYKDPDPECDLDYVPNQSRAAELDVILSNSFGFGGQNSSVLIERSPV